MEPNETMVEEMDDVQADDTLEEDVIEETDESESEDLSSLTDEEEEEQAPAEEQPREKPTAKAEPGYVKQRIDKAVQKAIAETRAQMQADFDRQMAPIREKMLTDEAKELVRQGEFKSVERAKEYLQLKQGIAPQTAPQAQQPRNENGQYAPKQADAGQTTRINMLAHQAKKIQASRGLDVMKEFNTNPEVKQKIISGEMDFYDVAEEMSKAQTRKPPAPMRSPNGASGTNQPNAIESMSKEQFARLEKRISEGARYNLR